jgi:hypothetical protein
MRCKFIRYHVTSKDSLLSNHNYTHEEIKYRYKCRKRFATIQNFYHTVFNLGNQIFEMLYMKL